MCFLETCMAWYWWLLFGLVGLGIIVGASKVLRTIAENFWGIVLGWFIFIVVFIVGFGLGTFFLCVPEGFCLMFGEVITRSVIGATVVLLSIIVISP